MENDDVVNQTAEVTEEPTVEADVKATFSKLLEYMREQDARLDRLTARQDQQDQINVMQQNANALLGEALKGHQQIIEADHPSKPTPPEPPPIVH